MNIIRRMNIINRTTEPERSRSRIVALLSVLSFMVLPVAAFADDDEKPVPIDPQTAAQQNHIIGAILGVACLAVAWYYWRRWQIIHSGNQVHGTGGHQD